MSNGPQSILSFSKEFRHTNIITYDGEIYLAFEFDDFGVHTRNIHTASIKQLIRGLKSIPSLIAIVAVSVEDKQKHSWKPFLVRSCNEIDRYISGVDIGFTFNPKHLYNKLLKSDGINHDVLYKWRR